MHSGDRLKDELVNGAHIVGVPHMLFDFIPDSLVACGVLFRHASLWEKPIYKHFALRTKGMKKGNRGASAGISFAARGMLQGAVV